jgi:hypothetical protein
MLMPIHVLPLAAPDAGPSSRQGVGRTPALSGDISEGLRPCPTRWWTVSGAAVNVFGWEAQLFSSGTFRWSRGDQLRPVPT